MVKRKLIEVALPLEAISKESAREKSIRHGHPSTLHLWWARRPLAAARAVLWSSLVDDPSSRPDEFPTEEDQKIERKRLFDILERLIKWENSNNEDVLAEARQEIHRSISTQPNPTQPNPTQPNPTQPNIDDTSRDLLKIKVLDPFCGGGAIPLEAQRLGLPAYGGDLNPVPLLITKGMVEIPPRFAGRAPVNPRSRAESGLKTWRGAQGLAEDIRYYGEWMRERAWERIGHLYPKVDGKTAIAWLWARTVQSPDPAWKGQVPLLKSGVLRNKPGKPVVWVEPVVDRDTQTVSYKIREGGTPGGGTVGRGGGVCVATGASFGLSYVREQGQRGKMGEVCIGAVVEESKGRGYVSSPVLPDVPEPSWKPVGKLMGKATDSVPLYGMTEWAELFTDRQLVTLTTFSDLLLEVREVVEGDAHRARWDDDGIRLRDGGSQMTAYTDAVVTYLAFVVNKCADYWSNLCSWHNSGEKIRNTFGRQAIAMVWDYAEANPFSLSSGNWLGQVDWVMKSVAHLPTSMPGEVRQRDAVACVGEAERPVVSTDPPYYDNIQYADLSDFFYVWLRRNVGEIWPEECATLLTPKGDELVANHWRAGSKGAAKEHFESGMFKVMEQIAQKQHSEFPATLFYAFKQQETKTGETTSTGWETFLQGLVDAGLEITATWPVRTEMGSRMISMGAAALASSVVLACRPRPDDALLETRGGFVEALRAELPGAVGLLQEQAIPPVDMAQSAIGLGMRVFSRYRRVVEASGDTMRVRTALALINEVLGEILSEEEMEMDADSRFALTWYRQFGFEPGPFGDAETLALAMNISVAGVVEAEVAKSKGGQVRLLNREELDPEWDPTEDKRLTVWELTQHLTARLEMSEVKAGELLARAGGFGDKARHLAYVLYEVANGAGRTEDAVAYNSLVATWNSLLVEAGKAEGPSQQTF